jgi:hypothetical protein
VGTLRVMDDSPLSKFAAGGLNSKTLAGVGGNTVVVAVMVMTSRASFTNCWIFPLGYESANVLLITLVEVTGGVRLTVTVSTSSDLYMQLLCGMLETTYLGQFNIKAHRVIRMLA